VIGCTEFSGGTTGTQAVRGEFLSSCAEGLMAG